MRERDRESGCKREWMRDRSRDKMNERKRERVDVRENG